MEALAAGVSSAVVGVGDGCWLGAEMGCSWTASALRAAGVGVPLQSHSSSKLRFEGALAAPVVASGFCAGAPSRDGPSDGPAGRQPSTFAPSGRAAKRTPRSAFAFLAEFAVL